MIISDKQELRRCVKQLVRRASVCEADLSFDVAGGELGVSPMLDTWARPASTPSESLRRSCADQTPFHPDALAMFAALDAMDFPVQDLDRAASLQRSYERDAYIREVLDTMRAKCVLLRVAMKDAEQAHFDDDRFCPLLEVEEALFAPGRYGVDYAQAARKIVGAAKDCGARNVRMASFDEHALEYCVLPACQDGALALHIHLKDADEVAQFALLLDRFDGVRALVSSEAVSQRALIDAAAQRVRMLVRLTDLSGLGYALETLGTTRFVPFGACASLPEMMLGRWTLAREEIWQALSERYLPLARAGYELSSAAIERDVRMLLCENLLALCRPESI